MSVARKIAIVTGSNKGIGYEIVRGLLLKTKSPLLVYATARNATLGINSVENILADDKVASAIKHTSSALKFHQLDISNLDSIQKFKQDLQEEHGEGSISVLINNAGIAGSMTGSSVKNVNEVLAVNYWGTKNLTDALLPLIKRDGSSKIIIVASTYGSRGFFPSDSLKKQLGDKKITFEQLDGLVTKYRDDVEAGREDQEGWAPTAYQVSKAVQIPLTRIFARENNDIMINSVCPGWVKTDLGGKAAPGTAEQGSETPVYLALEDIRGVSGEFWHNKTIRQW